MGESAKLHICEIVDFTILFLAGWVAACSDRLGLGARLACGLGHRDVHHEWQPVTLLKRQRGGDGDGLYEKARALEAAKYMVERVAAQGESGGERRSPRLMEAQAREV